MKISFSEPIGSNKNIHSLCRETPERHEEHLAIFWQSIAAVTIIETRGSMPQTSPYMV